VTIARSIQTLRDRVRAVLPVDEYAKREELTGLAREALERRLEEPFLEALIGHAVLPRYAFPTDVVTFWVSKLRRPVTRRSRGCSTTSRSEISSWRSPNMPRVAA
jgi:hypothetical protein